MVIEEVRKARKAAVMAVNKCIVLLEQKVSDNKSNVNTSDHQTDQPMDISGETRDQPTDQQKANEEKMDSTENNSEVVQQNDTKSENKQTVKSKESDDNQSSQNTANNKRKETAV